MKFLHEPEVTLVDHMGSDLTVVNAARVSFDKESEWCVDDGIRCLTNKDEKLISYLAKHNHWTPFGHIQAQFRIKAPVYVARQLVKHQVGLVWNEVSRRYVDDEPEFFQPSSWRKRPDGSVKQGSSVTETVKSIELLDIGINEWFELDIDNAFFNTMEHLYNLYKAFIKAGVAPEQARMVLPLNHATEWYWTGSVAAFARVCKLRLDPHAQKETAEVAVKIDKALREVYPVSWSALMEN